MTFAAASLALFPTATAVRAAHTDVDRDIQVGVMSLFDELNLQLLRYAMSFGLPVHDAEDVLQEVFLALFRHLSAARSRENLHGWAFRTTHHLALKRRASIQVEQRRLHVPEKSKDIAQYSDGAPGQEEGLLFSERQRRLHSVVRALPQKDQLCLQLRAEGFRYREIASRIGVSLGSVASSLARSFQKLQRMDER